MTTIGAGVAGVVGMQETAAAQAPPSPLTIPAPMTKETGTFNVNGRTLRADYEARTTLWEVIAIKLGLTGTNRSCNRASCGACSVLIDGELYLSCLTLAETVNGRSIETLDGMKDGPNLHPLQRAFMEQFAAQCGYCTPGMLMAAKALLDRNPSPTRAEVVEAISGNICRCTGYEPIINAVLAAATSGRARA